jgi:signal transduction histidine kinase
MVVTIAYLIPAVIGAVTMAFMGIPLCAQVAMLALVFLTLALAVQFWTTRLIASSASLSAQLLQAQRTAEKASAIKSAIIANTSHELRTPLNAVIGFSEAISQQILGPVGNPKYLEYAQSIPDIGRHLLQIINDILDISRIESGKHEMHETSVSLDEVAEFSIRMIGDGAAKGGVTI